MQWSQIKTLLILSFFILNIYLLIQFLEKREQADIGVLEIQQSTIEDQLQSESIEINELPTEKYEETYISVKPRLFSESDLESLNKVVPKQKSVVANKNLVISQFKDPIPIKKNSNKQSFEKLLEDMALYSSDYTFWNWNEELNIVVFFQKDDERPIYYNQNGLLLLFLNDDNETLFYMQTYLGEAEQHAEKRELISPLKAIEILYNQNELKFGDEVTSVNIGFHTRVPLESGVQVFAPIWKVNVNSSKDYFVNAIEGVVFSSNEEEFLREAIKNNINRVDMIEDNEVIKATVINVLKNKLE